MHLRDRTSTLLPGLDLADERKQNLFFLGQVQFDIGPERDEAALELFEHVTMSLRMRPERFVQQTDQAWQLLSHEDVVRPLDVVRQFGRRCRRPVLGGIAAAAGLQRSIQFGQDLIDGNPGVLCGLGQGRLAPTAVVDAQSLQNHAGFGMRDDDIFDGRVAGETSGHENSPFGRDRSLRAGGDHPSQRPPKGQSFSVPIEGIAAYFRPRAAEVSEY